MSSLETFTFAISSPGEFLVLYWLVGLGPKFLDIGSQPSVNGSPRHLHTSSMSGQA